MATEQQDRRGTIPITMVPDDRDQWYEMYRAWQQLEQCWADRGLLQRGTDRRAWEMQPGYNVPKSKAGGDTGWIVLPSRLG